MLNVKNSHVVSRVEIKSSGEEMFRRTVFIVAGECRVFVTSYDVRPGYGITEIKISKKINKEKSKKTAYEEIK